MIGVAEIKRLLPHRYPMLLVDRAMWTDDGALLVVKAITCNEPWYDDIGDDDDHGYPATLLIESWMQAAGVVLCLTGGILGILFGSGAAMLLSKFAQWNTLISPRAVVVAFGFSALIGIFFGLWPAKRAASLDPIQALRYE